MNAVFRSAHMNRTKEENEPESEPTGLNNTGLKLLLGNLSTLVKVREGLLFS